MSAAEIQNPPPVRAAPRRRRDWWSKTLAGVVLGFALGVGVGGLVAPLTGDVASAGGRYQLAMWLISPVWLAALSSVYLFASGLRAWLWLGGANAAVFLLAAWLRHLPS